MPSVQPAMSNKPSSEDFFNLYSRSREKSQRSADSQQLIPGKHQQFQENSHTTGISRKQQDQQVPSVEKDSGGYGRQFRCESRLSSFVSEKSAAAAAAAAPCRTTEQGPTVKRSASEILALFSSKITARQTAVADELNTIVSHQPGNVTESHKKPQDCSDQLASGNADCGSFQHQDLAGLGARQTSCQDTGHSEDELGNEPSQRSHKFAEKNVDEFETLEKLSEHGNTPVAPLSLILTPDSFLQCSGALSSNSEPLVGTKDMSSQEQEQLDESQWDKVFLDTKEELGMEEDTQGSLFTKSSSQGDSESIFPIRSACVERSNRSDTQAKDTYGSSSEAVEPNSTELEAKCLSEQRWNTPKQQENRHASFEGRQVQRGGAEHVADHTHTKLTSHPGSLFEYGALSSAWAEVKNNGRETSAFDEACYVPDQGNGAFDEGISAGGAGHAFCQTGLSPEFYSPTVAAKAEIEEWKVAPLIQTKVIPAEAREVGFLFMDSPFGCCGHLVSPYRETLDRSAANQGAQLGEGEGEIHEVRKGIWAFFLDCAFRMLIGWASKLRSRRNVRAFYQ